MNISLPFHMGQKAVHIRLPEGARLILPNKKETLPKEAVEQKIIEKLSAILPSNGEKACLIVDDHTRPTPTHIYVPPVVELLLQRFTEVVIAYAPGTHNYERADIEKKIPPETLKKVKVVYHDAFDHDAHVFAGISRAGTPVWINREVAECAFIMGMGSVFPSEIAGFTGGGKILVPGVAHYITINFNHLRYLSPFAEAGVARGNPVYEDIQDCARIGGLKVVVDFVLGWENESPVMDVFVGPPEEIADASHRLVREIYQVPFPGRFKLVIAAPGGREDIDFVQAAKAVYTANKVLSQNGRLLLCASMPRGLNWEEMEDLVSAIQKGKIQRREDLIKIMLSGSMESFACILLYRLWDFVVARPERLMLYTCEKGREVAKLFGFEIVENVESFVDHLPPNIADNTCIIPYASYMLIGKEKGKW